MKKAIITLSLALLSFGAFSQVQQPPKEYPASLSINEWEWVLSLVDNAAVPGEQRKFIQKKIVDQLNKQLTPPPSAKDSTAKQPVVKPKEKK